MAGPYDYNINIPQPPANNFLQSLLGIQQLKGLQQQSQLAEQQAAIQRQQAAFAQEKQPLELQQIQAGIAAQQASAEHSGAATGLLGVQTQAAQSALEENQRKNKAVAAYQNEALKLAEDPTSWDANKLKKLAMQAAALDQPGFDGMNSLLKAQPQTANILSNAASEVLLSVKAGKPAIAKASLENYIAGVQAALDKNPEDKSAQASLTFLNGAKTTLENDPTGADAALQASNYLFNLDPVKAEAVAKALKGTAEISEIEAKTKKVLGEIPGQEKSLPSSILRENAAIDKKVASANEMADKLSQAAEAMRALPSVGSAKEWWTNVKPKLGFGENPEIAVRTNAAQLAGLGMLGAESSAMGGAIRSNVQFQYATSKLPDAWSAPQEVAKRLDAQAEVQRKLAQLMTIDAEWNSAFRGNQKANKDEQILGMDVALGTTKTQFKEMAAKQLFPAKGKEPVTPAPTKTDGITGTPDLQSLLNKYR